MQQRNVESHFKKTTSAINSISSNPAFNFLKDSNENIYSLTDGEPFND